MYKTSSRTARGTQRNPVSKNKMKQNEIIPWPWVDHITFVSSEECRTNCSGCSSEYLLFTAQSPAPNNNKKTVMNVSQCTPLKIKIKVKKYKSWKHNFIRVGKGRDDCRQF